MTIIKRERERERADWFERITIRGEVIQLAYNQLLHTHELMATLDAKPINDATNATVDLVSLKDLEASAMIASMKLPQITRWNAKFIITPDK